MIPSFCQNLRLMQDQAGTLRLMSAERWLSVGEIPASLDEWNLMASVRRTIY
jgi:hypothetical protein